MSPSFKNQHDLRKHMETHNEGAAYHCSVEGCDYSSRMAHTMNQHYKRVHEVLQTVCRGRQTLTHCSIDLQNQDQCQSLTFFHLQICFWVYGILIKCTPLDTCVILLCRVEWSRNTSVISVTEPSLGVTHSLFTCARNTT